MAVEQKIDILVPDGKHIRPSIEQLLERQGIKTDLWTNGKLHADVRYTPVTLTFQNHADVIGEVEDGISQAGFVGSDRYAEYLVSLGPEKTSTVEQLARFELFNPNVRLSLLVRDNPADNRRFRTVEDLRGARILTTYPGLVMQFLREKVFRDEGPMTVEIYTRVSGKEEGHVDGRKFAAAGVIVDTGTAMKSSRLRELAVVMTDIQPVLVYNKQYFEDSGRWRILNRFLNRLQRPIRPMLDVVDLIHGLNNSLVVADQPELPKFATVA